jgi:hypothetical protein
VRQQPKPLLLVLRQLLWRIGTPLLKQQQAPRDGEQLRGGWRVPPAQTCLLRPILLCAPCMWAPASLIPTGGLTSAQRRSTFSGARLALQAGRSASTPPAWQHARALTETLSCQRCLRGGPCRHLVVLNIHNISRMALCIDCGLRDKRDGATAQGILHTRPAAALTATRHVAEGCA